MLACTHWWECKLAIQVPAGNNFDKILPADVVFAEQHQVAIFVAPGNLFLYIQRGGGNVYLAAKNRLEHWLFLIRMFFVPLQNPLVVLLHIYHELNGGEHITMVSDSNRVHAQLHAFLNQILCVDHAIEQGVFSVNV